MACCFSAMEITSPGPVDCCLAVSFLRPLAPIYRPGSTLLYLPSSRNHDQHRAGCHIESNHGGAALVGELVLGENLKLVVEREHHVLSRIARHRSELAHDASMGVDFVAGLPAYRFSERTTFLMSSCPRVSDRQHCRKD